MTADASRRNRRRGIRALARKFVEPVDIMVIRRFGRVFRVNLSGGMLLLAGVFSLAFLAASIWLINQYVFLYFAHQNLSEQFEKTKRSLDEYRYQADVIQRYAELVKQFEEAEKRKISGSKSPATKSAPIQSPKADRSIPPEPAGTTDKAAPAAAEVKSAAAVLDIKPPSEPTVDASRFSFQPESNGTAISFQLFINRKKLDGQSLDGYIFLAFISDKPEPGEMTIYPNVTLQDGVPADPKQGLFFSIKQGKFIKGKAEGLSNASQYRRAWVLAYAQDGTLLMKKLLPEGKK